MFWTMTFGCPGIYLEIKRDTSRAAESVPPPAPELTMMRRVFPS